MKLPDLYYFEAIKWHHKPSHIFYAEYEPQESILCELWRNFYIFKIYTGCLKKVYKVNQPLLNIVNFN